MATRYRSSLHLMRRRVCRVSTRLAWLPPPRGDDAMHERAPSYPTLKQGLERLTYSDHRPTIPNSVHWTTTTRQEILLRLVPSSRDEHLPQFSRFDLEGLLHGAPGTKTRDMRQLDDLTATLLADHCRV